jgi:hypothetical protein
MYNIAILFIKSKLFKKHCFANYTRMETLHYFDTSPKSEKIGKCIVKRIDVKYWHTFQNENVIWVVYLWAQQYKVGKDYYEKKNTSLIYEKNLCISNNPSIEEVLTCNISIWGQLWRNKNHKCHALLTFMTLTLTT